MAGEYVEILGKSAWFAWGTCPAKFRGKQFQLLTSDGEALDVNAEGLCMARNMMELATEPGTPIATPFKKASLTKIVEYLNYHAEIKPFEIRTPLQSDNLVECGCSKWDATFINMEKEVLFDMMVAALTMDIPSLYFLAGAKATLLIKGKEPTKLVKDFKLSNDLPDDEEEQLTGLFNAQKEKVQATPDDSGLGGVAILMNAVFQAAERNGILAPSKTEDPCESNIPLKSYRHAMWRTMLLSDWTQFKDAPEEVLSDRDLFFACVSASRGAVLEWAPGEFREDKALILEAVKYNGENLKEAADSLKSDRLFVMEAIEVDGAALAGASDDLRGDKDFIMAACALGHGKVMKGVKDNLKADQAFVFHAACTCPETFKYVSDSLRYNDAFVLQVVTGNGLVLQYVPMKYQADRAVVKAAVDSDAGAAAFAHAAARAELNVHMPYDGEPVFKELKARQDLAGIGAKKPAVGLVQWARQPRTKEQAEEDGIIFKHVKSQKIVQFSALSTMTANMGQSNYVSANCFLDKMPFYERPETDAVTLMWGAVGNIGMRWKAFASQDMLNANPDALMLVDDAAKVLTITTTKMDPPEWYAASFFDEWTRQAMLSQTAGIHAGEDYQAITTSRKQVEVNSDTPKRAPEEEEKKRDLMKAPEAGPLGSWPTLLEELVEPAPLPEVALEEGMRVQLRGLQPAKNGLLGTLVKKCKEDKWKVKLDKGDHALLKAEYIIPAVLAPPANEDAARQKQESAERRARLKASAQN
mmetsp:Transcript_40800/g.121953  ORF Transcript_40800/g.121953 Transcript_40800/m.121953 type:complete len:755 (+) Transcript_40800:95-2359(+)